jgi:PTH1 family peptidyl-tRNA hydrolase
MWLIAGLGNPGPKYALTRHNIGFMSLDYFAHGYKISNWNQEHQALTCKFKIEDQQVLLVKPQTYMNLSGESVQSLMHFYKIDLNQLIVVQDDIDQNFASMRFHKNRGHGGHNGIRSISEKLGSAEYIRLKLGVGRPSHPEMQVADYVLQKFNSEEQTQLPDFLNRSVDALEMVIFEGLNKASTVFNK